MSIFVQTKNGKTDKIESLTKRISVVFLSVLILSACGMTEQPQSQPYATIYERMDNQCISQVQNLQEALSTANPSQYLTLAHSASHCVGDIAFSPQHPDNQIAMQFNALAVFNFVKAGDMHSAKQSLVEFRSRFPQQDLLFDDYSSFVDTATALIKQQELSEQSIAMLNINPVLRAELKRQRKWSLN